MDDLISKQAAILAIEEYADRLQMVNWKENPGVPYKAYALNWAINTLRDLPSAQPEHGRWIDKYGDGDWHCTRCGAIVEKHEQDYRNWYFCYHCGAKMDGVSK